LQDRADQLLQLVATLTIGGVVALALLSFGGWLVVGSSLHRALQRERRFVDEASHELRTPISVIRGRLELALSRPRSLAELQEIVRRALSEAEGLSRLADDLLVLSRSQDGKIPIHRQDVRLSELFDAAVAAHRPSAEAGGVRVEIEAPAGTANLDPLRVRQVVDNLLDNAIRHAPRGGTVRISAVRDDGTIRIQVQDPGDGFPLELLPRAFEPFSRGPAEASGAGAGLGLAIVKAVAEAHGGAATAENAPQGGARVTVLLGG
jgi:two-component system OmpR family sensor kinase